MLLISFSYHRRRTEESDVIAVAEKSRSFGYDAVPNTGAGDLEEDANVSQVPNPAKNHLSGTGNVNSPSRNTSNGHRSSPIPMHAAPKSATNLTLEEEYEPGNFHTGKDLNRDRPLTPTSSAANMQFTSDNELIGTLSIIVVEAKSLRPADVGGTR
jgi:hypothetical protein